MDLQFDIVFYKKNNIHWKEKSLRLLCFINLIFFSSLPAYADDDFDQFNLSPEQLFGATVVSASRTAEKLWDVPGAVYVLSHEDIKRSGATSIPEALRLVPGVQVARINTSGWAISIRGFNSALANKLLVLIDGRKVYDPLFSGVYWDIQDTMLEDIERIEVIRGPGATMWGSNAVNGVINIITKKASDTQGNLVSITTGNQERGIVSARHGGKLKNNGYYRVYTKYLNRDEQQTLSGTGANDEWDAYRSGFHVDWEGKDNDDFTVQGDIYHSQSSQFRFVPSLSAPYTTLQDENILAHGSNVLGKWHRILSNGGNVTVQSYVDYTFRDQFLLEDERLSFDLDVQYALPQSDRHQIVIGSRYHRTNNHIAAPSLVRFSTSSRMDEIFSGFIQDKITLIPEEWFLTLGSKFEHNDYSGTEMQPNARLQWHLNQQQMMWTSVSRAVRTPSRLDQDFDIDLATAAPSAAVALPVLVTLEGNPDFTSEELTAYEAGYRHQLTPSLLLDLAIFYNKYKKLSTFSILPFSVVANGIDPTHVLIPISATNDATGKTYGIETVLDWQALQNVNLSFSHSFLQIGIDGPSATTALNSAVAEDQSPHQQFNIRSLWDITNNISFDTTLYYVSALPAFEVESFWRLDTRLGWDITDRIAFNIVGQNLLDNTHREFASPTDANASKINRSFYGNITWQF